jgi:hypothetical protein
MNQSNEMMTTEWKGLSKLPANSLCIGDWVDFYSLDGDSPLTGFIVDISKSAKVCHVFVPARSPGSKAAVGTTRAVETGRSRWNTLPSRTTEVSYNNSVRNSSTRNSPRGNQTYTVRLCDATPSPTQLHLSDIPALTDLSLDTRDEKWFYNLVNYTPKPPVNVNRRFLLFFVPLLSLFVVLV